jgi:predicted amidohydrolase
MSSRFGILLVAFSAIGFQLCLMPAWGQEAAEGKSNPGHLRMALINPKLRTTATPERVRNEEKPEANVGRHLLFIDRAAAAGAEFVGFPELSVNGYEFSPNLIWLRLDGPEVKRLSERARERSVYLAIGIAEKDDSGKCWNSHVLIGPDGKVIGRTTKSG